MSVTDQHDPRRTRILVQFSPAPHGGVETHVYHFAMLMAAHGGDVTLISIRRFDLNESWTRDLLRAGVSIVRPPALPSYLPGIVRAVISMAVVSQKVRRRSFDFAIAQSHGRLNGWLRRFVRPGGLCLWHEQWYGVPSRGDNYTADSTSPAPTRFPLGMRLMLRSMDGIITGCELSRRNLSDVQGYKKPILVVPPLDQIDGVAIARERNCSTDSPMHLGMIARLGYGKGVATLIDIWPELAIGDAHLHLYGPDPNGQFASMVASRGLCNRIHVHGVFPRERLSDILGQLDLGLMLSFEEGYGLVVWEYMACGLPFLMTNVGAFSEFTTGNPDGLSVSATKDAIKAGIRTMVDRIRGNQTSRIRLQEFHRRDFSYERTSEQYLAYFSGGASK